MENELFLTCLGGAGGVASVTFYGCSLNNLYFDFFSRWTFIIQLIELNLILHGK